MATPRYIVRRIGDRYVTEAAPSHEPCHCFECTLGGVALVVAGVHRGGVLGGAASLAGAGMLYKAVSGRNPLGWLFSRPGRRDRQGDTTESTPSFQHDHAAAPAQAPTDVVDESSMESFPASDPPGRMTPSGQTA